MNRAESRTKLRLADFARETDASRAGGAGASRAGVEAQAYPVGSPPARVRRMRFGVRGAALRRLLKVGASLAALMLLLPVIAQAHPPVGFDVPNVIHACKGQKGKLRQVISGDCVPPRVAVHWSITGPAAAAGLAGPTGPIGPIGAAGTNGIDAPTRAIGHSYGGGIVFYVYDGGRHGLIAALADQGTGIGITWSNTNFVDTFARGNGIGAGEMNTGIIIAVQASDGSNNFAARVAADYSVLEDGVTACNDSRPPIPAETCISDWYLPSKNELNLLFLQRDVVGGFALVGSFTYGAYWSSTEVDSDVAWGQAIGSGGQGIVGKSNSLRVRAIRAF